MASNSKTRRQNSQESSLEVKIACSPDLIGEIIKGFSVKQLIRCMLVSKVWHGFIKEILLPRLRQPSGLIIQQSQFGQYHYIPLVNLQEVPKFDTNRLNSYQHTTILQSCNGLLLLLYRMKDHAYISYSQHCVLNVATGQLDFLGKLRGNLSISSVNLVSDPCSSSRYKVVAVGPANRLVNNLKFGLSYRIQVYSSGTGEWKNIAVGPFDSPCTEMFHDGVLWKTNVIWINHGPKMSFLCFKVETEELYEIAAPPMQHPWRQDFVYLSESGGHLHLIELQSLFVTEFDVFELEDDLSRWFLKYHVNLEDQNIMFDHPRNFPFFLSLIRGIEEEDVSLVVYIPGQMISYNLKAKTSRKLCDLLINVDELQRLSRRGRKFVHHHALPVFFINSSNSRIANS